MKKFRLLLFVITLLMTVGGGIMPAQAAVSQIAAGAAHTIVLKTDGTLWAWGWNGFGQLGDGTTIDRKSPVQIGGDKTWTAVAAGDSHTIALKADGTLWAWGQGKFGRLGTGTTDNKLTPVKIGTDTTWTAVAAGGYHTIALKTVAAETTLWAWGLNGDGELGDGSTDDQLTPVQIGTDTNWISMTAGGFHTIALKTDGTLWAWGWNNYGQLGDTTTTTRTAPVPIGTDKTWAAVAAGWTHSIALETNGTLWAWGFNDVGQLGIGSADNIAHPTPAPIDVAVGTIWSSVAAGYDHTMALQADGTLWSWGWNNAGQLGIGSVDYESHPTPAPIDVAVGTIWSNLTAGYYHSIALKEDGTLWAWGFNGDGQLGDGTTTTRTSPVLIPVQKKFPWPMFLPAITRGIR